MLDIDDQSVLTVPDWNGISSRATLPESEEEFFGRSGHLPVMPESRRRYHRSYLRARAVVRYLGDFQAVYLCDVSRSGIGLYSPVQFLPFEPIEIWVKDQRLLATTTTCLRVQPGCYRCGAEFHEE